MILDDENRIMGILAGRPKDHDWDIVHAEMSKKLEEAGNKLPSSRQEARRGQYFSLSTGVSHGGGQKVCIDSKLTVNLADIYRLLEI